MSCLHACLCSVCTLCPQRTRMEFGPLGPEFQVFAAATWGPVLNLCLLSERAPSARNTQPSLQPQEMYSLNQCILADCYIDTEDQPIHIILLIQ